LEKYLNDQTVHPIYENKVNRQIIPLWSQTYTGAAERGARAATPPPQKNACHIKELHYLSGWQGNQYEN